jgi:hypothetical protein
MLAASIGRQNQARTEDCASDEEGAAAADETWRPDAEARPPPDE